MTALTIAKAIAVNVGVDQPTALVGATDPNAIKLLQFMNEAGQEAERRADWGQLEATHTITGTGSNDAFPLPADFSRLSMGTAVSFGGSPVRGSLSRDEWFLLSAIQGNPRYFRLNGTDISFYPYLKSGEAVSVSYMGKEWCSGGASFSADGDTTTVPEILIERGAIWRWRRSLGADFSDFQAEYEALLEQLSAFDQRERSP